MLGKPALFVLYESNPKSRGYPPGHLSPLGSPLQRLKDLRPQLAGLAYIVGQAHIRHAGLGPAGHAFELGDDIFEPEGFAGGLRAAGFELDVDDVDMEMVVSRLICSVPTSAYPSKKVAELKKREEGLRRTVNVKLQHIPLHPFLSIDPHNRIQHLLPHPLQPLHMPFLQIPETPEIHSLHQRQ